MKGDPTIPRDFLAWCKSLRVDVRRSLSVHDLCTLWKGIKERERDALAFGMHHETSTCYTGEYIDEVYTAYEAEQAKRKEEK